MGKHCLHEGEAGFARLFLWLHSDGAFEKIFSYLLHIFNLDCRLLNTSLIVQAAPRCLRRAGSLHVEWLDIGWGHYANIQAQCFVVAFS